MRERKIHPSLLQLNPLSQIGPTLQTVEHNERIWVFVARMHKQSGSSQNWAALLQLCGNSRLSQRSFGSSISGEISTTNVI